MQHAANTVRAYRADWSDFAQWCTAHRRRALPATPDTLARYLGDVARRRRPATVRRRLAAVHARHVHAGCASPALDRRVRLVAARAEWQGRSRRRPTEPLYAADLHRCSTALPDSLTGRRDRALLLVAYGAALRRTELVGLDTPDIRVDSRGDLLVRIARGTVRIPPGSSDATCAVRAWLAWRAAAGARLRNGPAFRPIDRHGNIAPTRLSDRSVTLIVQRAATGAGLIDPHRLTGRSLRLGMILAAASRGTTDAGIMAHTGHRSRRLVQAYRNAAGANAR